MKRGSYIVKPMRSGLPDFGLAKPTRLIRDRLEQIGYRLNRGREYAWLIYREEDGILHARLDNLTEVDQWIRNQKGV